MEITSKELYKARAQIMGIATLLVICVHLYLGPQSAFMSSTHRFAQIGVDMFFFLSGIGCYQSISQRGTLEFYWRRIKRVLPSYLLVFVLYGTFKCLYEGMDTVTYWREHSMLMFPVTGETTHWFIFGILFTYLITPIFYKGYRPLIALAITLLVSSQIYFLPWQIPENIRLFNELFIARIPVYMLGLYIGQKFSRGETITIDFSFYLTMIGIIVLMCWNNYFNTINTMAIFHYISILGAMYFTFFLVMVFNKVKMPLLGGIGQCSLELYLVEEKIMMLLAAYTTMSFAEINIYGFILTLICALRIKTFVNQVYEMAI